jgi:hypothetical protein
MDYNNITNMTGVQNRRPEYKLNEVTFNGQTGVFVKRCLLEDKIKSDDGKEIYKTVDLGKELEVVFLKHRRKLAQFIKNKPSLNTNEHNHKDDMVMLFGVDTKPIKGIASDLRETYPGLKTNQIVYCFVPSLKEIVRLTIKGSSLGSENKPEGVLSYYSYLNSFGDSEHNWQYKTLLKPSAETSSLGAYYAIQFVRGEKLADEQIEKVAKMIEEVHNKVVAIDAYYQQRLPSKEDTQVVNEKERVIQYGEDVKKWEKDHEGQGNKQNIVDGVEYPEEEINPEDIPF